jgi:hypothetical protein
MNRAHAEPVQPPAVAEGALDAEFSAVRERHADAGLGWLTASPDTLRAPLDAVSLGEFEPDVWICSAHPASGRGVISLAELASMDVIHGPRRTSAATYDRWLEALRDADPRFSFINPPFRVSLPVLLAFAAAARWPTAVLTGPAVIAETPPSVIRLPRSAGPGNMARVSIAGHPLTATAALVWHGDLPRPLQQLLFDTAVGVTPQASASLLAAAAWPGQEYAGEPTSEGIPACMSPASASFPGN